MAMARSPSDPALNPFDANAQCPSSLSNPIGMKNLASPCLNYPCDYVQFLHHRRAMALFKLIFQMKFTHKH